MLLENDADVNARDAKNRTPLHVASVYGDLDGARLLLQHGADIHAQDAEGRTPFQAAAAAAAGSPGSYSDPDPEFDRACQNVMKLLLEHGAKDHRAQ